MIFKKHLSRRTFLRGAGVTLALPFLDSMLPAGSVFGQAAAAKPTRFAAIYLLTLERSASGNPVKPFAEYARDVDPLIAVSTTRIMALVENSDNDAVEAEMKTCVRLMDLQRKLIDQMRELVNDP